MKKTLLTVTLAAATLAAFAQGKVALQQDGGSLITLTRTTAADSALLGQPVPTTGPLPSGVLLEVGLFGGATSNALTLQTSEIMNNGSSGLPAGWWASEHCVTSFPGYTANARAFFQVEVWDAAYPTLLAAEAAGSYYGEDNVFSMIPGTSITYPGINNGGQTTWVAAGNETQLSTTGGPIPEPATLALAGLGAAALVIFRRRK